MSPDELNAYLCILPSKHNCNQAKPFREWWHFFSGIMHACRKERRFRGTGPQIQQRNSNETYANCKPDMMIEGNSPENWSTSTRYLHKLRKNFGAKKCQFAPEHIRERAPNSIFTRRMTDDLIALTNNIAAAIIRHLIFNNYDSGKKWIKFKQGILFLIIFFCWQQLIMPFHLKCRRW